MDQTVKYRGEWWLPGSDVRWPGTFVYQPESGVEVDLAALRYGPEFPGSLDPYARVYGQTVTGQAVTLADVIQSKTTLTVPGGVQATLSPWRAFVGAWFEPEEEIAFDRLFLRLGTLNEWTGITGISMTQDSQRSLKVDYEVPERRLIASTGDIELTLSFGYKLTPSGMPTTSVGIDHWAQIELTSPRPTSYETLDDLVRRIRDFFMFVSRDRVSLSSLSAYPEIDIRRGDSTTRERKEIDILYRADAILDPRRRAPLARNFLFTLPENGPPGEDRLSRWLALGEDLGPVFDLYLVSLYQPRIFAELQFLSLAQAAESLHSRRFDTKTLPKEEHRAHLRAVLAAAPASSREWAGVRLADANRKSFRVALAELVETLPADLKSRLDDIEHFTEKVRVTRNYLTHWSEHLRQRAASGATLIALTTLLRCILEALILLELGFDSAEVDALLARNHTFQRDLVFGLESLAEEA